MIPFNKNYIKCALVFLQHSFKSKVTKKSTKNCAVILENHNNNNNNKNPLLVPFRKLSQVISQKGNDPVSITAH